MSSALLSTLPRSSSSSAANDASTDSKVAYIWLYHPCFPLAIVAAILYTGPMIGQYYLTCFRYRYRQKFFILVAVAAHLEVVGYIVRAVSTKNLGSIPPYAISGSFIVIAPLFVCAALYVLLSRLALAILPANDAPILGIPPRLLARVFVTSDVVSFLTQGAGSGAASSGNWRGSALRIGEDLVIAGLALQVATFSFFLILTWTFHCRARVIGDTELQRSRDWKHILTGVYVTGLLVLIRTVYRLIEFALGIHGYPFTHEWIFYVLESLPMVIALSVLCVYHPGKYLPTLERIKESASGSEDREMGGVTVAGAKRQA